MGFGSAGILLLLWALASDGAGPLFLSIGGAFFLSIGGAFFAAEASQHRQEADQWPRGGIRLRFNPGTLAKSPSAKTNVAE